MEAKGGGELRRLNIIYFLSRNGQIEHPHLIRIHIFSRNGVHLRDVKRWLSELRGEDMVKSFAWSYKRKYKQTGFVWQDLLDEDLITPISDNEYILKGTQISSTPIYDDVSSYGEKEIVEHKESTLDQIEAKTHKILSKETIDQENSPTLADVSSIKQSSEFKEESPPFSSDSFILAYNSIKLQKETHLTARKLKQQEEDDENENENFGNNCLYSRCLYKSKNKKNGIDFDTSTPASSTSSTPSSSLRSRSYSRGSSNTASRTVDAKNLDTVKMISQRNKNYESMVTSKPNGLSSFVGLFVPTQIVTFN